MKKIGAVAVLTLLLSSVLSGCSLAYSIQNTDDGSWMLGVSKNDAFAITCVWNGEEDVSVTVPDEINGIPVTRLGGYTGRGYPCPFHIELSEQYCNDSVCSLSDEFFDDEDSVYTWFPNGYEIIEMRVTLRLGKNIDSLYYHTKNDYYRYYSEGQKTKLYCVVYSYDCAAENETFYSKNGVLYERSTGAPAEWKY